MADPDTTLTDFALAALCAGFALALLGAGGVGALYGGLFAALGVAALAGTLWHGWWPGVQSGLGGALWRTVMLSVGGANLFLWLIAARIAAQPWLGWIGWGQLVVYILAALWLTRSFILPSAFSLPPTLVLLALFLCTPSAPGYALGAAALGIALIGAGLQAAKVGFGALRLGPNGLYHAIQALAFTLLFAGLPGS
ncbi:MAG: hypothetical protein AUK37_07220 [Rhodobacterales bacterium CG2_30_65_12]|nr:MAG: hypothetical protein AUK37_07220 [Rhodobacterales bacterium CG2_30_65_12]